MPAGGDSDDGQRGQGPQEWREKQPGSEFAHIKTKEEQESIKAKLRDPNDPLKLVIVRDVWLTGTDIPPLTYLYVDKPLKGHGLIQAIARVNRVFPGKTGGVVVDYIGITDALKEATHRYTQGGGKGKPIGDLSGEAVPIFFEALEAVRKFVPPGVDITDWRAKPKVEREDWLADFVGHLMGPDEDAFLNTQEGVPTGQAPAECPAAGERGTALRNRGDPDQTVERNGRRRVEAKKIRRGTEETDRPQRRSPGRGNRPVREGRAGEAGHFDPGRCVSGRLREEAPRGSAAQTAAEIAGGRNLLSRTSAESSWY